MIRNLVSNALKFSPRGSVATLHAVFVPSNEAVVADNAQSGRSVVASARQMIRFISRVSARATRNVTSVSAVVPPPTDNTLTPRLTQCATTPFTAGYLRISVVDHG